ncbi:MAG: uncharacterized protein JWR90_2631 [Marmoricola sp.]|nr:uncharacterized protein [Marmoricola sp.]
MSNRAAAVRHLPVERIRTRFSAAVYGNILVLAALVAPVAPGDDSWNAVIVVVVTPLTTYLAHVAAHAIGGRIGRAQDEVSPHLQQDLRDAVPILSAGTGPALILTLGALDVIPQPWPFVVAGLVLVARLASAGVIAQRSSGERSRGAVLWSGLGLGLVALVAVVAKAVLTH